MIKNESLYLAGPLVFYVNGIEMWQAWRREALYHGFKVALPNDNVPEAEPGNKRQLSASIFKNCRDSINQTTTIIANLETYRGMVPDGGTVFEVGMAYGKGAKCYGYTKDKRPEGQKYGLAKLDKEGIWDLDGRKLPNYQLPFGPCLVGSSKIIEGTFSDALAVFKADLEEASKLKANRNVEVKVKAAERTLFAKDKPLVYLSTFERYDIDAQLKLTAMKEILSRYGFEGISPLEDAPGVERVQSDDLYEVAYNTFDHYQQHVRNCDIILANLNPYHGYEPNDDVSFECGMAFQLGKKLFAYVDDLRPMVDLIPNGGEANGCRDVNGMNVEDFENPLNLMFGASFTLFTGAFEDVVKQMADALLDFKLADDLVPPVL